MLMENTCGLAFRIGKQSGVLPITPEIKLRTGHNLLERREKKAEGLAAILFSLTTDSPLYVEVGLRPTWRV
jgi:hypothetical protein